MATDPDEQAEPAGLRLARRRLQLGDPLASHIVLCRILRMPTNLAIDDDLLTEAQKIGGHRTKKETVNEALREYVQRRRQIKVLELFGQIDFDPAYDYKKQRRRS